MRTALLLLLAACTGSGPKDTSPVDTSTSTDTDTTDTDTVTTPTPTGEVCETLEGTCGHIATGDTGCPVGYRCWGPSAFVCYRGDCDLPICLPPDTRIWTPSGERPLHSLRRGDVVYTLDLLGTPQVAPVAQLGSTLAPADHRVVQARLADGRTVTGSPGHPTVDGQPLGDLVVGQPLDGSVVVDLTLAPYAFPRTYDLRPAGPTGTYRADGVWLGSTLR